MSRRTGRLPNAWRQLAASLLAGSLIALSIGCAAERNEATAITVSVKRDASLGLNRLSYQVFSLQQDPRRDLPVSSYNAEGAALDLPFVVSKRDESLFLLVVQGFSPADTRVPLVEHRVRAQFEQGKTLTLRIFLSQKCARQLCDQVVGQTCFFEPRNGVLAGQCGPAPGPYPLDVISTPGAEANWSPPYTDAPDGGPPDSGFEAGVAEAGPDASACPLPPGFPCNPVAQCGCSAGQHCQIRNDSLICAAIPAAPKADGAVCNEAAECGIGLACSFGVCRRQCLSDQDCGGDICNLSERGFGRCMASCGLAADKPCPPDVSCAPLKFGKLNGNYCMVPQSNCEHVLDGECDEPERGTGVCAAGTDTSDCCAAPKAKCDLVAQCGCEASQSCTIVNLEGATPTLGCRGPGTAAKGDFCVANEECQAGLGCAGNMCMTFCTSNDDCPDGFCQGVINEQNVLITGVRTCLPRCDFATGAPCGKGAVCATRASGENVCFVPPDVCSTPANGRCDETTRLCKPGTDPECPH